MILSFCKSSANRDDDFVVNAGELDVEETEPTQKHYDPISFSLRYQPATQQRYQTLART